ncbi:hypothetical protein ACOME3_007136 [Neoechinorhynchus agilis]
MNKLTLRTTPTEKPNDPKVEITDLEAIKAEAPYVASILSRVCESGKKDLDTWTSGVSDRYPCTRKYDCFETRFPKLNNSFALWASNLDINNNKLYSSKWRNHVPLGYRKHWSSDLLNECGC